MVIAATPRLRTAERPVSKSLYITDKHAYAKAWFERRGLKMPAHGIYRIIFADYFRALDILRGRVLDDLLAGREISDARVRFLTSDDIKKYPQFRARWEQAKLAWAVGGAGVYRAAIRNQRHQAQFGRPYRRKFGKHKESSQDAKQLFRHLDPQYRPEARRQLARLMARHAEAGRDCGPGTLLYASLVGVSAQLATPDHPQFKKGLPRWLRMQILHRERSHWLNVAVARGMISRIDADAMCTWRARKIQSGDYPKKPKPQPEPEGFVPHGVVSLEY